MSNQKENKDIMPFSKEQFLKWKQQDPISIGFFIFLNDYRKHIVRVCDDIKERGARIHPSQIQSFVDATAKNAVLAEVEDIDYDVIMSFYQSLRNNEQQ